MRSLVIGATTIAFVVFASTLAMTRPSCAGTIINGCGKFSFSVPDDWKESKEDTEKGIERTAFANKEGTLYVLAGPIYERTADLSDDDVTDFIDEQFDKMKVTSDKKDKLEQFNVRLLEGTGMDEEEPIVFKALALDTGTDTGVLIVVISGSAKEMEQATASGTIDRILRSLRPH